MDTIIGTWELSSLELKIGKKTTYPFGENLSGLLIYQENGYMSGIMSGENRPDITSPAIMGIDNKERVEIAKNFIAYSGRYEVDGNKIIHKVIASFVPNLMNGQPHISYYLLQDKRLWISSPPAKKDGKEVSVMLIWKRAV